MTISIVSNSRAEAGPLQSVIKALPACVVTSFDSTDMSPAVAMSQALTFFTAMFTAQKATRVVVLGDRYETLAAALAALFLRVPVAHIHGGETTTGAFDDPMRHAITHIADLHFVATQGAGDKVSCLLGGTDSNWGPTGDWADEPNYHIHLTGAPGLDGVPGNSARRDTKRILCTYHPETRAEDYGLAACRAMLVALHHLKDYEVLFTSPNADPGAHAIAAAIDEEVQVHPKWHWVMLDHDNYVQAMQSAALVIGNSSAGIIEAPWVGVPTVNVGLRQDGREMARSIWTTNHGQDFMRNAINCAMEWTGPWNPIYRGGAAERIAAVLKEST